MTKQLRAAAVRIAAHEIVGQCSDYEIMFCASAAHVITCMAVSLEDLPEGQLESLATWIMKDYLNTPSNREWDVYSRYV
jgi:hypothetical protein